MNLTPRWVPYLQSAGFEALHWSKVGQSNASDEEIRAYAAGHGLIVLTHDLDFSAILAAKKGKKPSVVQVRAQNIFTRIYWPSNCCRPSTYRRRTRVGSAINHRSRPYSDAPPSSSTCPLNQLKEGGFSSALLTLLCDLCANSVASVVSLSLHLLTHLLRHRLRLQKQQQIIFPAGLRIRSRHVESAERMRADHRAGTLPI